MAQEKGSVTAMAEKPKSLGSDLESPTRVHDNIVPYTGIVDEKEYGHVRRGV